MCGVSVEIGRSPRWAGRLKDAIKAAGFSTDGFARRMGVHRTTLWRINNGQIKPTEEWSARAEMLLAVSVEDEVAA